MLADENQSYVMCFFYDSIHEQVQSTQKCISEVINNERIFNNNISKLYWDDESDSCLSDWKLNMKCLWNDVLFCLKKFKTHNDSLIKKVKKILASQIITN